jgi:phenylpropionate dioxygenase-like ring-hydroxylating dioxygenase large terminal subunit
MIPAINYISPQRHQDELNTIFSKNWIFVGLKLELKGLCHLGVRIGERELVVQLDAEFKPRAYRNVCSHRLSRLCKEGLHTGPVRCPYHGWVYDRQGIPIGIPSKASFPEVIANPLQFRLHEYSCEMVGEFIFIRIATEGLSLQASLGQEYDFLLKVSRSMSHITDSFESTVEANWKVVIENALEGYHVPAVHSQTLMQSEGMGREETLPVFFMDDDLHSNLEHAADSNWLRRFTRTEKQIGQWPWRFEHYTHHHVFPNLTITSFMGYSFHIQLFQPKSHETTIVRSQTLGVTFKNTSVMGEKMLEKIYEDGNIFTRHIFSEDATICKEVQAGLRQAERLPVFGNHIEDRVKHFQSAYLMDFKS